jgi:hypothetical protein
LSQSYDKVNFVFDYGAVEVYLHAFSTTALDGDGPLTSTFGRKFTTERTTVRAEHEAWCESEDGETGNEKGLSHNNWDRTTFVHTVG